MSDKEKVAEYARIMERLAENLNRMDGVSAGARYAIESSHECAHGAYGWAS